MAIEPRLLSCLGKPWSSIKAPLIKEEKHMRGMGYTHLLLNQPLEASRFFESALSLSRSIMDRSGEVSCLYYAATAARDEIY